MYVHAKTHALRYQVIDWRTGEAIPRVIWADDVAGVYCATRVDAAGAMFTEAGADGCPRIADEIKAAPIAIVHRDYLERFRRDRARRLARSPELPPPPPLMMSTPRSLYRGPHEPTAAPVPPPPRIAGYGRSPLRPVFTELARREAGLRFLTAILGHQAAEHATRGPRDQGGENR